MRRRGIAFILSVVTKLKIISFLMALCRETRESIHQIRISHSSNIYNNTMDCTSWWWRKSDYRIPNDLTKGWNWDKKRLLSMILGRQVIRFMVWRKIPTTQWNCFPEILYSREILLYGTLRPSLKVRNQKWYRDWALSTNHFFANLDLLWVTQF